VEELTGEEGPRKNSGTGPVERGVPRLHIKLPGGRRRRRGAFQEQTFLEFLEKQLM